MNTFRVSFTARGTRVPPVRVEAENAQDAIVAAKGPTLDATEAIVIGPGNVSRWYLQGNTWSKIDERALPS